jgi:hypothetical protein
MRAEAEENYDGVPRLDGSRLSGLRRHTVQSGCDAQTTAREKLHSIEVGPTDNDDIYNRRRAVMRFGSINRGGRTL